MKPVVNSAMGLFSSTVAWSGTANAVGPGAFDNLLTPSGSWGWGDPALLARLDTPDLPKSFDLWCGSRADVKQWRSVAKAMTETTAQGLVNAGYAKLPTFAIAWWEGRHLDAVALIRFAGNLELCPMISLEEEGAELLQRLAHFTAKPFLRDSAGVCVSALLRQGTEHPHKSPAYFDLGCRMAHPNLLAAQPEGVRAALRAWQLETACQAVGPSVLTPRPRM